MLIHLYLQLKLLKVNNSTEISPISTLNSNFKWVHFFLLPHLNWQISQNFFAISRQTFKIIAIQDPNFSGKTFQRPKFRREKAKNYHLISKKNFTCFTICICWLSYFCGCIQKSRPWKFGIRKLIFIKRVDLNGFSYFFSLKIPIKILKLLQNLIRYSRTTPISFLFYWYSIKKKNMKRKE